MDLLRRAAGVSGAVKRRSWTSFTAVFALVFAGGALLHSVFGSKETFEGIVISCAAAGRELELCQSGAEAWSKQSGVPVRVVAAPNDASERLGTYTLLLATRSADIDVFSIDTTWAGMIGNHFLDLTPHADPKALPGNFPGFLENNRVDGRLVAMPWFIDAGVLYYRKDLLERYGEQVPTTWQELTRIATRIQSEERKRGNAGLWGFVFQARAYEGLTCNALEWVASQGGGTFVDGEGRVTVNNTEAQQALTLASSWIGTIAPRGVLNYAEEESRGVFQSGKAVFMRNWPYAWKLANGPDSPIRGKVGVSVLPGKAATLGGWSLAVSKYSRHPEAAVSLALYLTSEQEQRRRLEIGGFQPTLEKIYRDPELLLANPFLASLRSVFQNALPRPSRSTRSKYNRVSLEIAESVHRVLAGEEKAEEALARLERTLERIGKNGRW